MLQVGEKNLLLIDESTFLWPEVLEGVVSWCVWKSLKYPHFTNKEVKAVLGEVSWFQGQWHQLQIQRGSAKKLRFSADFKYHLILMQQ